MDIHVAVTDQAVRSLEGLTAFSALPNAPVLPVKQRRSPLGAVRLARSRLRGVPSGRRTWTPVTSAGHGAR